MPVEDFVPDPPKLRLEPILRFQRYRTVEQVAAPILEAAREMIALAEKLADPRFAFVARPIARVTPEGVELRGGPRFSGRCFETHLARAREAVCFVMTLGPALDERIAEMAEGDELLEALFLDTAGWLAIEDAVRAFRAHLATREPGRACRLSPRLAPGYQDWPLTEQAQLFSAFDGAPLPVRLSEYSVMTPKKSLSGLFGVIPREVGG
jgi:hypothetical protein